MHPLVRDLYKRVLVVGRDYPNVEFQRVKDIWKAALRNPENCPSWYRDEEEEAQVDLPSHQRWNEIPEQPTEEKDIDELYFAIHRGRQAVKEMIGIIQLRKYRTLKKRYNDDGEQERIMQQKIMQLEQSAISNQQN
jgi:hypothetical protein